MAKTAVQLALEGTDKNADEIVAEIILNDSDVQELLCCFLGTSDQCFTGLFERTYPYIYYDKDAYKQYKQLSKFNNFPGFSQRVLRVSYPNISMHKKIHPHADFKS